MAGLRRDQLIKLIDTLPDAAMLLDVKGRVTCGSARLHELLGVESHELTQRPLSELAVEGQQEPCVQFVSAVVHEAGGAAGPVEVELRRQDGSAVAVELRGTLQSVGRAKLILAVARQVPSREFVRGLVDLEGQLRSAESRASLIRALLSALPTFTGASGSVLVVHVPGEDEIIVEAADGVMAQWAGQRLPTENSVSRRVLDGNAPYVTSDPGEIRRVSGGKFPPSVRGLAFVPLLADRRVPGVLGVVKASPILEVEVDRLRVISDMAGAWLQRLALHEDLVRSVVTTEDDYENMIEVWARALDRREQIAEGHCHRVSELTLRLARELDVDAEELPHIRRGAMLHDIGKMLVPEAVLLKRGPLEEAERELVRRHTEYAYDMLGSIGFLRPALPIPTFHHERWDGKGYPRRLAGEDIPFAARIFAAVDVYDSMTSDRAYGVAQGVADALCYISGQSGRHFDPRVVDALLTIVGEPGGGDAPAEDLGQA